MTAGDGDFNRAFHMRLSFHVAKIDIVVLVRGEKLGQIAARRKQRDFAAQELKCLPQILHAVDVDLVDHGGFARVRFRNEDGLLTAAPCFERDRQNAFDRSHRTVQGKLADKTEFLERRRIDRLGHGNHAERNRQIEARTFFLNIGRREIDCRPSARPTISAIGNCRRDPITAFFHGGIG